MRAIQKYLPVIAIFFIGICIAIAGFYFTQHWQLKHYQAKFNNFAQEGIFNETELLEDNLDSLQTVAAFFHASQHVDADEFNNFVRVIFNLHLGLQAIAWTSIELAPKAEHHTSVLTAQTKFPVTLAYTRENISFDLNKDLNLPGPYGTVLQTAIMNNALMATAPLIHHSPQIDFLAFLPVYTSLDDTDPKYIKGLVIGIFSYQALFEKMAMHLRHLGINIQIFDTTLSHSPQLIFGPALLNAKWQYEKSSRIAGRDWLFVANAIPGIIIPNTIWQAWLVLLALLTFTFALSFYFYISIQHTSKIEQAVKVRTKKLAASIKKLKAKTDELNRSHAELKQFSYAASHDLQEPLRMVSSYTQLLKKRYSSQLDANAIDFINYALEGAVRMKQLLDDLLQYSRLGSQLKPLVRVSMNTALQQALANLTILLRQSNTKIDYPKLPDIKGDVSQLCRLWQNLIANAVKYCTADQPQIEIQVKRHDEEWIFVIKDNGIGIETKHFERIFVIFQRLHNREAYDGTGLGLAVCKKIVENHGGHIWVESKRGAGSSFYFSIPAKLTDLS